jgi:hypothetical protein
MPVRLSYRRPRTDLRRGRPDGSAAKRALCGTCGITRRDHQHGSFGGAVRRRKALPDAAARCDVVQLRASPPVYYLSIPDSGSGYRAHDRLRCELFAIAFIRFGTAFSIIRSGDGSQRYTRVPVASGVNNIGHVPRSFTRAAAVGCSAPRGGIELEAVQTTRHCSRRVERGLVECRSDSPSRSYLRSAVAAGSFLTENCYVA